MLLRPAGVLTDNSIFFAASDRVAEDVRCMGMLSRSPGSAEGLLLVRLRNWLNCRRLQRRKLSAK